MKEPIIGIDLGTTNSAVAIIQDGIPFIIPVDDAPTMPSVVGIDAQGELLVGQPALNQVVAAPESTVMSIKRQMGKNTTVLLGNRAFAPEEVSALILGRLKQAAEAHLGTPVKKAVITVPAFFGLRCGRFGESDDASLRPRRRDLRCLRGGRGRRRGRGEGEPWGYGARRR